MEGCVLARWSEAVKEAGLTPSKSTEQIDTEILLLKVTEFACELGNVPTHPEMSLRRRIDPTFPVDRTIAVHDPSKSDLIAALRQHGTSTQNVHLLNILPEKVVTKGTPGRTREEGSIYRLKSGNHDKIGRSDQIERRIREVTIAQREAVTLVHTIITDDPPRIEAYWHRRFADRRANGEWFRLTDDDVRAFTRRKAQ
jgi:hypothetical protein